MTNYWWLMNLWLIPNDCWVIIDDWWQMIGDWWLMIDDWWLMTGDLWLMTGDWWLMIDDWWLITFYWGLRILWLMIDDWWLMTDVFWLGNFGNSHSGKKSMVTNHILTTPNLFPGYHNYHHNIKFGHENALKNLRNIFNILKGHALRKLTSLQLGFCIHLHPSHPWT